MHEKTGQLCVDHRHLKSQPYAAVTRDLTCKKHAQAAVVFAPKFERHDGCYMCHWFYPLRQVQVSSACCEVCFFFRSEFPVQVRTDGIIWPAGHIHCFCTRLPVLRSRLGRGRLVAPHRHGAGECSVTGRENRHRSRQLVRSPQYRGQGATVQHSSTCTCTAHQKQVGSTPKWRSCRRSRRRSAVCHAWPGSI